MTVCSLDRVALTPNSHISVHLQEYYKEAVKPYLIKGVIIQKMSFFTIRKI